MANLDELYKAKENSSVQALQDALAQKKLQEQQAEQQTTQQYKQLLPGFQSNRDQAVVNSALAQNNLRSQNAAFGQYGGGTAMTQLARLLAQQNNAINQQNSAETNATQNYNNSLQNLRAALAQDTNSTNSQIANIRQQIAAELAQAKEQQAQAYARSSRASSGGSGATSYKKADVMSSAMAGIKQMMDQGLNIQEVRAKMLDSEANLAGMGLSVSDLNSLYNYANDLYARGSANYDENYNRNKKLEQLYYGQQ